MLRLVKVTFFVLVLASPALTFGQASAKDLSAPLGLGRVALPEEIVAWDVDVLPDGRGLPKGSGDVFTGEEVFAEKCAACHGDFAEGVDNWPVLAGGFDTLADKDPVKTVGSYWPYLSSVWDYVHRSMPFGAAQTLSDDEVYAIVAYMLYSNDMVDDDFELSHENFTEVVMHNTGGFMIDDRASTEYPLLSTEPCMKNCRGDFQVLMRATDLNVTPGQDHSAAKMDSKEMVAVASTPEPVTLDPELVAAGAKVFKKCKSCHQIGENAKNKIGPQLNGVIGRTMGSIEKFKYSKIFKSFNEEGRVWDEEAMHAYLENPKGYAKGTKMVFKGLKNEKDRFAIVEYLKSTRQ